MKSFLPHLLYSLVFFLVAIYLGFTSEGFLYYLYSQVPERSNMHQNIMGNQTYEIPLSHSALMAVLYVFLKKNSHCNWVLSAWELHRYMRVRRPLFKDAHQCHVCLMHWSAILFNDSVHEPSPAGRIFPCINSIFIILENNKRNLGAIHNPVDRTSKYALIHC